MESQLQRPVGHTYDQDPHNAGIIHSAVEDEHPEKKSVLKKVKDKAKKIKDKLKKDGQGHEQELERHYAHGDPEGYEEEEDKEMAEAPIYESGAARSSAPIHAQDVNLEKPTAVGEDRYDGDTRRVVDRSREENVGLGLERPKPGVPGGLQEDRHAPKAQPAGIQPSNHEAKVTNPSGEGGREVDLNPMIGSFAKMDVSEETPRMGSEQRGSTGSHDKFAPQGTPTEEEFSRKTSESDSTTGKSSDQGGYAQKMSVATSVIADKAISAKNMVASKLGYSGSEGDKSRETEERKDSTGGSGAPAPSTGYVHKVAGTVTEKLAPVYEKVAAAGSSVVSKVKGSGTGNEGAEISGGTQPEKRGSEKEFLADKLMPSEEDKALSQAQDVNLEKPTAVGEGRFDDDTKRVVDRLREENVGLGLERPKPGVPVGLQEDPHAPKAQSGGIPPPNYETKVTNPSGEGSREVDLNPMIGSFAKMDVSEETPRVGSEQRGDTGSHDQFAPQGTPTEGEFSPKTSESDSTTGKSSDQGGYVQKMSAATSVIADKAISAKNMVASKLGYSGSEGDKGRETEERKDTTGGSGAPASPIGYAHKAAGTVTEKLAPVYEKVASTGSSVVSKVKGSGTGNEGAELSGGTQPDKGVSIKEFLAEKLKPGEEDKALSEVISGTLHNKKEDSGKVVESNPSGKVTESEDVAMHLGSEVENKRERDDAIAAGRESSGTGVVDRLKGAVSSWISKGGEQKSPKGSPDSAYVSNEATATTGEVEHQPGVAAERRLQESAN